MQETPGARDVPGVFHKGVLEGRTCVSALICWIPASAGMTDKNDNPLSTNGRGRIYASLPFSHKTRAAYMRPLHGEAQATHLKGSIPTSTKTMMGETGFEEAADRRTGRIQGAAPTRSPSSPPSIRFTGVFLHEQEPVPISPVDSPGHAQGEPDQERKPARLFPGAYQQRAQEEHQRENEYA